MIEILLEELHHELNAPQPDANRVIDLLCLLNEPEARREMADRPGVRSIYSELQAEAERFILEIEHPRWHFEFQWQVGRKHGTTCVSSFTRHLKDAISQLWKQLVQDGKLGDLNEIDTSKPASARVVKVVQEGE